MLIRLPAGTVNSVVCTQARRRALDEVGDPVRVGADAVLRVLLQHHVDGGARVRGDAGGEVHRRRAAEEVMDHDERATATTARNATTRVATRAGKDTSHHLASSQKQRRLAAAPLARTVRPHPIESDLAIGVGAGKDGGVNDETVMVGRGSRGRHRRS